MRARSIILVCLLAAVSAEGAHAQLISPGRLIEAHAHLEGVTNCTSCHTLGQRGVDPQRCLACHTPLRDRIAREAGFHSTVTTNCGTCHKDHFGRDFDPIRLDPDRFDHDLTGYPLIGGHTTVDCQSCHQPRFITAADVRAYHRDTGRLGQTFLGVSTSCQTCHRADNPHGPDFARSDCASCHTPQAWSETLAYNHAETGFPLVGMHASLSCTSCHGETAQAAVDFSGLRASCSSCHAEADPHGNQFRGRDCASCHGAEAWRPATRFDHNRARFALTGQHRRVECSACHGAVNARTTFTGIDFAECSSCHADPHEGGLGADCSTCHSSAGWRVIGEGFEPGRFDHAATGFPLVGAHNRISCQSCHGQPARRDDAIRIAFAGNPAGATFPRVVSDDCASCHVDAHDGVFRARDDGGSCDSCHGQDAWLPTTFGLPRHQAESRFPLTGAHIATPCFACHGGAAEAMPHFAFASTTCESCHAEVNPHGSQFADASGVTSCGNCHDTAQWDLAQFDHSVTRFPLTGAHAGLACQNCHTPEARPDGQRIHDFAGLSMDCASCHSADDPHRGQFEGRTCESCHDTKAFTVASFDHSRTRFPLQGGHRDVTCATCHGVETAPDGQAFVRFVPIPTDCASCHGGGSR